MASSTANSANPQYTHLSANLSSLIALFVDHPANGVEVDASSMLPKNKIQFMHEFLTTAQRQLSQVDPSVPESQQTDFRECLERCMFAQLLIEDQTGKLSAMTQEEPGEELDFGEDIREAAKELVPTNTEDDASD